MPVRPGPAKPWDENPARQAYNRSHHGQPFRCSRRLLQVCAGETACRAAIGKRLVPLCPECLVLVLAGGQAALALRLAEPETPISPS